MKLVCLLEEIGRGLVILPEILPEVFFETIAFEGKRDLAEAATY